jgi:hypothetical protein
MLAYGVWAIDAERRALEDSLSSLWLAEARKINLHNSRYRGLIGGWFLGLLVASCARISLVIVLAAPFPVARAP